MFVCAVLCALVWRAPNRPEHGATSDPRVPNTTTVSVTVTNLPPNIKTAQLFRIDDNVTNPYTTWCVRSVVCLVCSFAWMCCQHGGLRSQHALPGSCTMLTMHGALVRGRAP